MDNEAALHAYVSRDGFVYCFFSVICKKPHLINADKYMSHIAKCQGYREIGHLYSQCQWNANHWVLKDTMNRHRLECPDKPKGYQHQDFSFDFQKVENDRAWRAGGAENIPEEPTFIGFPGYNPTTSVAPSPWEVKSSIQGESSLTKNNGWKDEDSDEEILFGNPKQHSIPNPTSEIQSTSSFMHSQISPPGNFSSFNKFSKPPPSQPSSYAPSVVASDAAWGGAAKPTGHQQPFPSKGSSRPNAPSSGGWDTPNQKLPSSGGWDAPSQRAPPSSASGGWDIPRQKAPETVATGGWEVPSQRPPSSMATGRWELPRQNAPPHSNAPASIAPGGWDVPHQKVAASNGWGTEKGSRVTAYEVKEASYSPQEWGAPLREDLRGNVGGFDSRSEARSAVSTQRRVEPSGQWEGNWQSLGERRREEERREVPVASQQRIYTAEETGGWDTVTKQSFKVGKGASHISSEGWGSVCSGSNNGPVQETSYESEWNEWQPQSGSSQRRGPISGGDGFPFQPRKGESEKREDNDSQQWGGYQQTERKEISSGEPRGEGVWGFGGEAARGRGWDSENWEGVERIQQNKYSFDLPANPYE